MTAVSPISLQHERRRETRIPLAAAGRVMLDTRQELECQVTDISLSGMHLRAEANVSRGATVVAYIDPFGRLQGQVVRKTATGFAVHLNVAGAKRERLSRTLDWLALHGKRELPAGRVHERIVPKNAATYLSVEGKGRWSAKIIDFSRSGAAICLAPEGIPAIDTRVTVGRTAGRVARHLSGGVGIEFYRLIPIDLFDEGFCL